MSTKFQLSSMSYHLWCDRECLLNSNCHLCHIILCPHENMYAKVIVVFGKICKVYKCKWFVCDIILCAVENFCENWISLMSNYFWCNWLKLRGHEQHFSSKCNKKMLRCDLIKMLQVAHPWNYRKNCGKSEFCNKKMLRCNCSNI